VIEITINPKQGQYHQWLHWHYDLQLRWESGFSSELSAKDERVEVCSAHRLASAHSAQALEFPAK
jgi:hypothetical protein